MSSDNVAHENHLFYYKLRNVSRKQTLQENPVSFGKSAFGTSSHSEFPVIFPREEGELGHHKLMFFPETRHYI